jgi:hypothetical protein
MACAVGHIAFRFPFFTILLNISFLDMKFHILEAPFLGVFDWRLRSIKFTYRIKKIEF